MVWSDSHFAVLAEAAGTALNMFFDSFKESIKVMLINSLQLTMNHLLLSSSLTQCEDVHKCIQAVREQP